MMTEPIYGQESLTVKVENVADKEYDRHSQEMKVGSFTAVCIYIWQFLQALSSEIVKTIRDIVALNPLYRATIQQIMEMGIR